MFLFLGGRGCWDWCASLSFRIPFGKAIAQINDPRMNVDADFSSNHPGSCTALCFFGEVSGKRQEPMPLVLGHEGPKWLWR